MPPVKRTTLTVRLTADTRKKMKIWSRYLNLRSRRGVAEIALRRFQESDLDQEKFFSDIKKHETLTTSFVIEDQLMTYLRKIAKGNRTNVAAVFKRIVEWYLKENGGKLQKCFEETGEKYED